MEWVIRGPTDCRPRLSTSHLVPVPMSLPVPTLQGRRPGTTLQTLLSTQFLAATESHSHETKVGRENKPCYCPAGSGDRRACAPASRRSSSGPGHFPANHNLGAAGGLSISSCFLPFLQYLNFQEVVVNLNLHSPSLL